MRFVWVVANDIRYQIKYGFYFLYFIFTILYIALLLLCPEQYKGIVASFIVLNDPAMLGSFFIGGIWLLEKGEGLHRFWVISPLKSIEYVLSKAISLAIISTISANFIVLFGLKVVVKYWDLSIAVFLGSMVFTTIGLIVASYARSVNHYSLLVAPLILFLALPPVFYLFNLSHQILYLLPGMALWHAIGFSVGTTDQIEIWIYLILLLWVIIAVVLSSRRINKVMHSVEGDQ